MSLSILKYPCAKTFSRFQEKEYANMYLTSDKHWVIFLYIVLFYRASIYFCNVGNCFLPSELFQSVGISNSFACFILSLRWEIYYLEKKKTLSSTFSCEALLKESIPVILLAMLRDLPSQTHTVEIWYSNTAELKRPCVKKHDLPKIEVPGNSTMFGIVLVP